MTADLRARVEALLATAGRMTEGPWRAHGYAADVCCDALGAPDFVATCNMERDRLTGGTHRQHDDATGIADLRNDAPGLLVELLAALAEAKRLGLEAAQLAAAADLDLAKSPRTGGTGIATRHTANIAAIAAALEAL